MTDELPPLPEAGMCNDTMEGFTADQMRTYAQEAARQERERCALAIEAAGPKGGALVLVTQGFANAIRSRSSATGEKG